MDKEHLGFPFSAVMNADSAKLAIKCMLVSPHIRTLLIQGVSGSAKTTLVRSIPNISDMTVVNMPLNTSEGQVIGSLDIERTIVTGERRVLPGLLEKADNGILYGDDCNLMDATILDTVLKAAADGTVMAERDGMSWSFDADVKFIGTANIAESQVNGHLMDMFDMCVTIPQTDNENDRYEIVRRKTEFDRDPKTFRSRFQSEDDDIASSVTAAMERVPFVTISDDLLKVIAELSCKLGVEGHRGDISLTNASKAVAALNGRDDVTLDDIKSVAGMCLGHRMTDMPDENTSSEQGQEQSGNERPEMSPSDDDGHDGERTEGDREQGVGDGDKETVFSIGNAFSVIDFTEMAMQRNQRTMKGYGKHGTMGKGDKRGRYVRSRISSQRSDIAIDASIRAAAPYQRFRKKKIDHT